MTRQDFNNTSEKLPAEDGHYLWDCPIAGYIPVIYQKGVWFLRSNKEALPSGIIKRWR